MSRYVAVFLLGDRCVYSCSFAFDMLLNRMAKRWLNPSEATPRGLRKSKRISMIFGMHVSMAPLVLNGCPEHCMFGKDNQSDKEAAGLLNPRYLVIPQWDDLGLNLMMFLCWNWQMVFWMLLMVVGLCVFLFCTHLNPATILHNTPGRGCFGLTLTALLCLPCSIAMRFWQALTHSGWLASQQLLPEQVAMYLWRRLAPDLAALVEVAVWIHRYPSVSTCALLIVICALSRNALTGFYLTGILVMNAWKKRGTAWPMALLPKPTVINMMRLSC